MKVTVGVGLGVWVDVAVAVAVGVKVSVGVAVAVKVAVGVRLSGERTGRVCRSSTQLTRLRAIQPKPSPKRIMIHVESALRPTGSTTSPR